MSTPLSLDTLKTPSDSAFRAKEQIKVLMALREAEYAESDVSVIVAAQSHSRLVATISEWLSSPKNCHEGRYTLISRPSLATDALRKHVRLTEISIREDLKIAEFDEVILVGKEVVILNIEGDLFFTRRSDCLLGANKTIKALRRISALEKAKGL